MTRKNIVLAIRTANVGELRNVKKLIVKADQINARNIIAIGGN
jgi:hypothetical protein